MAGLLADIGRGVARLTGMGEAPDPSVVPLDSQTQGMIEEGVTRAGRSGAEFANELNQGVQQSAHTFSPNETLASQADQRSGDISTPYGQALRGAYSAYGDDTVSRMMRSNQMKGQLAKADYMNRMSKVMMAQQRVSAQSNQMLVDAYNQGEMARAGLVNELFQTAGTGVAMYANRRRSPSQQPSSGVMPEMNAGSNYNLGVGYAPRPQRSYGLGMDYSGEE